MSKAAVAIYARVLANQYPNIKSSSISPGLVDTAIVADFGANFGTKIAPE